MRLRMFFVCLCCALMLGLSAGAAMADTVTYADTVYVYPGDPHAADALTIEVRGAAYDPQTFEPIEDPALAGAVFGVYAKDAEGAYIPFPNPDNPLEPLRITSGDAPVSVSLPRSVDLFLHQETAPAGYIVASEAEGYLPLVLPQALTFTNRMEGMQGVSLALTGVGGSQETALPGVSFTLEGEGQTHTMKTNAEGRATIFGIDPGTYTLRQTEAPEGYHIDTPETTITIQAHEPTQVALTNSLDGTLALRTLGLTMEQNRTPRLVPVMRQYEVLDADGEALGVLSSGEEMNLPAAREGMRYTLRAIGVPTDGYTSDQDSHTITLYPGQTAVCQTAVRSEKGFFRFAHVSAADGAAVAGGQFALIDANGQTVLTFEADGRGQYEAQTPLLPGPYTLHMQHGAAGYLFEEAPLPLEITPYFETKAQMAEARFESAPVPAALYSPVVSSEAQKLPSLFAEDASFAFTLSVFDGEPPLPLSGLSYAFDVGDVPGMTITETSATGAHVTIARRLPLDGVPEVSRIMASGTVSYTFSYRVDRDGTEETVPVSVPFETEVAAFASLPSSAPYTVSGHVYDADGALLVGHPVSMEDASGKTIDEMQTDPFGAYAFARLPQGATLQFHPPEGYGVRREGGDAQFLPLRTITGRVMMEGGLSGYPVTLHVGDEEPITPGRDGGFAVTGIFGADAVITAEPEAGVLARVENEGDTAAVWLYPAASITGVAKDPEGTPVVGLQIALRGEGETKTTQTDTYGKYTFDDLYPGDYRLAFAAPAGYVLNGAADAAVTLAAGEEKRGVDIDAMQPASIGGRLWDGETPYAGVTVTLMPGWLETITGEDGMFVFEGLPTGAYTLSLDTLEETIVLDMPGEITLAAPAQHEERLIHTVRPASLSGRIWQDTNDDGLATFDEAGLPGVQIALQDGSETVLETVTTDQDGQFAFDGLTPGRYRLAVTLPEQMIFAREAPEAERIVVGVDAPEGVSEWYTLASGEKLDTLVAGAVVPGSIEGLAFEDLDGDGFWQEAEPMLAGTEVALLHEDEVVRSVTTDAEGHYRFERLRMGDYALRITLPEGCMFTAQVAAEVEGVGSRIPQSTQRAAEYPVELRRWRPDVSVPIGGQRAASLCVHLWFDKDASGVNPKGAGYAGLEVALYALTGTSERFVSQQATDVEGNARFEHIRPGRYLLRYTLPEGSRWGFTAGVAKEAEITGTSAEIVLENGADAQAPDVGVTQLGRITGVVFEDANYDGLRDEQETGVTAAVALLDASGEVLRETQTKSGGAYAFEDVKSGRYMVRFTLPEGYAYTKAQAAASSHNSDVPETIDSVSQTDTLFLPMGEALLIDAGAYRLASISGAAWQDMLGNGLYASTNPPMAGIAVTLLREGEVIQATETNEEGAYRFAALAPGEYAIEIQLPEGMRFSLPPAQGGRGSLVEETEARNGQIAPFALRNGEQRVDRDIGIVRNGSLVGSAMDFKTGGGLAGMSVTLLRDHVVEAETVSGDGGSYRFDDVRPGAVEVLFEAPEHWIISEDETNPVRVQVPQGAEATPSAIYAIPEATLDGVLWLDGDGDGEIGAEEVRLANTNVQLYTVDGETHTLLTARRTDETGRYHFDQLLPGTYALAFESAKDIVYYEGEQIEPFQLTMGDAREDEAAAYIASSISGVVWEDLNNDGLLDEEEPGLPEITVMLVSPEGKTVLETLTDETGAYRFDDVPPVTCAVRVTLPEAYMFTAAAEGGSVMPETDGNVAETETMTLAMGDQMTGMDAGALRHTRIGDLVWLDADANGLQDTGETGIPGIKVTLWRPGETSPVAETETDQNGRYRFDAVRPGTYEVSFEIDAQQYLPTMVVPGLAQINSKLPWTAGEVLRTEAFVAQSGRYQLAIDAGLVPLERATALGWTVEGDGTITGE